MHTFMADVLRFLPVKVDSAGESTGKRLVNDVDLEAQDLDPHTVTLPVTHRQSRAGKRRREPRRRLSRPVAECPDQPAQEDRHLRRQQQSSRT